MTTGCASSITSGIISSMPSTDSPRIDKVRENRLRRMAQRQGKTLSRSRVRDPFALGYGIYSIDGIEIGDMDAVEAHLTRKATT
jgi:hypothetical protein